MQPNQEAMHPSSPKLYAQAQTVKVAHQNSPVLSRQFLICQWQKKYTQRRKQPTSRIVSGANMDKLPKHYPRHVLVVEKNDYIGGATVSRELQPGWIYSNCSYVCSLFRPEIYQALDLGRHGLEVVPIKGGCTFMENGDYYGNYHRHDVRRREIARHSQRDADAVIRFDADLMKWCRLIRGFLLRTPPDPTSFRPRDMMEFAHLL